MPAGLQQWLDIGCYAAAFAMFIVGGITVRQAHTMRTIFTYYPDYTPCSPSAVERRRIRVVSSGYFGTYERLVAAEVLLRWDERRERGTLVGKRWWQPFNARWTVQSVMPLRERVCPRQQRIWKHSKWEGG